MARYGCCCLLSVLNLLLGIYTFAYAPCHRILWASSTIRSLVSFQHRQPYENTHLKSFHFRLRNFRQYTTT
ncbi:hypothetical protein F4860DRAFT_473891 [Xylaria cubensis]|nr:hypothetical protein F4860DRAFT_473891 [Xylaria cubensis]